VKIRNLAERLILVAANTEDFDVRDWQSDSNSSATKEIARIAGTLPQIWRMIADQMQTLTFRIDRWVLTA